MIERSANGQPDRVGVLFFSVFYGIFLFVFLVATLIKLDDGLLATHGYAVTFGVTASLFLGLCFVYVGLRIVMVAGSRYKSDSAPAITARGESDGSLVVRASHAESLVQKHSGLRRLVVSMCFITIGFTIYVVTIYTYHRVFA